MYRTGSPMLHSQSRNDPMPPNPPLAQSLLEARRFGAPPFLVRNLRYVAEDRKASQGRLWDVNWSKADYRSSTGPRHLTLNAHASRCIVAEETALQLFQDGSLRPRTAFLDLTLLARQRDGMKFRFASRHAKIRVWIPTDGSRAFHNIKLDDLPFSAHFDLSSYFPLLSAPLAQLSLIVRVSCLDAPPAPAHEVQTGRVRVLVGSLILWKAGASRYGSAVSNAPNEPVTVPLVYTRLKYPFSNDDLKGMPSVHLGSEPEEACQTSIQLLVNGEVHSEISKAVEQEKPKIYVTLRYGSANFPTWDGFIRHDFMCPWCQRNCYRFRTLLSHFQIDHANFQFSLQGIDSHAGEPDRNNNVPFTVQLEVTPMNDGASSQSTTRDRDAASAAAASGGPRTGCHAIDDEDDGEIFVNPRRYRMYVDQAKRARENADIQAGMKGVHLGEESDSDSTVFEQDRADDLLSIVRDDLWSFCGHCGRQHDCSYNGKDDICSEWCEISRNKELEDSDDDRPLLANASVPREKKVDYRESLSKLQLYHIVSVAEMKEEHFDEDDPDSEEEVDQTWRLDLNIERVRSLEGVSTKEKILWMLWNRFAHLNYPIPSLYGERYTRYSLELFVLHSRAEIEKLKLRTQLFGFLRALHTHGLIDSKAILSVMLCLDGKKKRRDIGVSSRPEVSADKKGSVQMGKMRRNRRK